MNPRVQQQRKGAIALIIFLAVAFGTTSGILIATGLDWIPHSLAQSQPQAATVEPSQFLVNTQESFRELVAAVRPAVVSIESTGVQIEGQPQSPFGGQDPFEQFFNFGPFGNPFGNPNNQQPNRRQQNNAPQTVAAASGFLVDESGYILTNNHVVQGASEVKVRTDDGRQFTARIIGADPETDVAVLKIDDSGSFPYISLGDSDQLEVGDWVMAVGNPFGNLAGTVTVGIVSARNREDLQLPGDTVYQDFIQTDAAINLGNSGGPLVDIYGRAEGINTAITAQGSGIGFAIPINIAKFVYNNIREHGQVVRSWIGVTIQNLDQDLASNLGLRDNQGALVADVVAGDPADQGGLRKEDVILNVGETRITSSQSASRTIAALPVGQPVQFKIWRDRAEMTLTITPAQREEATAQAGGKPHRSGSTGGNTNKQTEYLGIEVQELTSQDRQDYDIPSDVTGVIITNIDPSGPGYEKGLREGMVIGTINHQDVASIDDYDRLMSDAHSVWQSSHQTVLLRVHVPQQDGTWATLFFAVPFE